LGIGDLGIGPITQTPNPKTKTPNPKTKLFFKKKIKNFINIKLKKKKNIKFFLY